MKRLKKLFKAFLISTVAVTMPVSAYFYKAETWTDPKTGKNIHLFYEIHFSNGKKGIGFISKENELPEYFTKKLFKNVENIHEEQQIFSILNAAKKLDAPIIVENILGNYKGNIKSIRKDFDRARDYNANVMTQKPSTITKDKMIDTFLPFIEIGAKKQNIPVINVEWRHELGNPTIPTGYRANAIIKKRDELENETNLYLYGNSPIPQNHSKNILDNLKKDSIFKKIRRSTLKNYHIKDEYDKYEKIEEDLNGIDVEKTIIRSSLGLFDIGLIKSVVEYRKKTHNLFVCTGGLHCISLARLLKEEGYKKTNKTVGQRVDSTKIEYLPVKDMDKDFFNKTFKQRREENRKILKEVEQRHARIKKNKRKRLLINQKKRKRSFDFDKNDQPKIKKLKEEE